MVYELRCYTLVPGKMPEYLKAAETIGRPARGNNFGVNHGYWTAEFGALNQIWHLWKYDSFDERTRLRGELAKNKDWTEKYVPIVKTCVQRQDLRLMNTVVDIKPSDGTTGNVYELRIYQCNLGGAVQYGKDFKEVQAARDKYIAALKRIESSEFFQAIRLKTLQVLYATPMAYAYFGYEGEAFSKGGYVLRGFSDLRWLPEVPLEDSGSVPI